MTKKVLEITQKELDKKIKEARQEAYEKGRVHGKAEEIYFLKLQQGIKAVTFLEALIDFLDERYEVQRED